MQAESGYGVVEPVGREGQPTAGFSGSLHGELVQDLDPHEAFHATPVDLVERVRATQVDQDLEGIATQSAGPLAPDFTEAWERLVTHAFDDGLDVTPRTPRPSVEGVGQETVDALRPESDQGVPGRSSNGAVPGREVPHEGVKGFWHKSQSNSGPWKDRGVFRSGI